MDSLAQEFISWEVASDEALATFERQVESLDALHPCRTCITGWANIYEDSAGRQQSIVCYDSCEARKRFLEERDAVVTALDAS